MPVYLYACPNCANEQEVIQNYIDAAPNCEICGALMIKRMGAPSTIFRGSGFHCNDYNHHKRRGPK